MSTRRSWPEPKLVRDIQVFLGFANFYQQFIQRFSYIALLLALILKTSKSTESTTRPEKSEVGFGDDGGNCSHDDGDGCNGDFNWKFAFYNILGLAMLCWYSSVYPALTSPQYLGQAYQRIYQLVWPRLWLSLMRLMLVVVVIVASRSKSGGIVKKPKKSQRSKKIARAISLEECLPKHQSSVNWRTRAFIRALTIFRALLLGPRALSISLLDWLSTRQFLPTSVSGTFSSSLNPLH